MNERNMQFRVGVVILAAFLFGLILVVSHPGPAGMSNPWGGRLIKITLDKAPRVSRDTPIFKAGVRIGRVKDVQLANNDTQVVVTAEIDPDYHIYGDERCKVVNSFPLGDASLEIVPIDVPGKGTEVHYGAYDMPSLPSTAPDAGGSLASLQDKADETLKIVNTAGRDIDKLANHVDALLTAHEKQVATTVDEAHQMIAETHQMIGEARQTLGLLNETLKAGKEILGDPNMRQTLKQIPEVLHDVQTAAQGIKGTFVALDQEMKEVEPLAKALGKQGPGMVDELDASLQGLHNLTANLQQFSEQLKNPQGSLGALLHDNQELYQRFNHLTKDLDDLTRDLKPILDDTRVFTDKIARHPELLGVRGAIKKDPGFKDSPGDDDDPDVPQTSRWPIGGSGRWSLGR